MYPSAIPITVAFILSLVVSVTHGQEVEPAEALPEHLAYLYQLETPEPVQQALFADARRWNPGDTIKVCFFGGDEVVRTFVAEVAGEWQKYAHIVLDFGTIDNRRSCDQPSAGFNQVRIGFAEKGYWSAVGTDSVYVLNYHQPSMNLQDFNFRYSRFQKASSGEPLTPRNVVSNSRPRDRATVLHEFGHALSLLHEHQNPALGCQDEIRWTGPGNVYDYYARPPNRWSQEMVLRNLGPIAVADPDYVAGEADPASIMIYAQPPEIFIRGTDSPCYVPKPSALSDGDKRVVAQIYPVGAPLVSDVAFTTSARAAALNVDPPTSAELSDDRIERIKVDLRSGVTSVRREARRQLAFELEGSSGAFVAELVADAEAGRNYREQVGVLVAIDKAQALTPLEPSEAATIVASLESISAGTDDETLREAIDSVQRKLELY